MMRPAYFLSVEIAVLHPQIEALIDTALAEDIGLGDRTSEALLDETKSGAANILAKSPGVICGLDVARQVFARVDPNLVFDAYVEDGAVVQGHREKVASVRGSLKSILTAERTALNFMQRMSGVATLSRKFALAVAGSKAKVVDTRKTIPGLRLLDKTAVSIGGAYNHRFGLFDGIMIKDNHIAAVGSVAEAVARARENSPHTLKIEVEAKEISQVKEAIACGADIILLDNMTIEQLREAVDFTNGRALLEASGGVDLDTIAEIASTGVDLISVGAITHSAPAMDISLDFV